MKVYVFEVMSPFRGRECRAPGSGKPKTCRETLGQEALLFLPKDQFGPTDLIKLPLKVWLRRTLSR